MTSSNAAPTLAAPHDPAELLSASRVAALLHRRKQDVLDDIKAGKLPSIDGRVPRWMLMDWQRRQLEGAA